MTWTAKTMPDDQVDPASLVGGMLQVGEGGEITRDGSGKALPEIDQPSLCAAMDSAWWDSRFEEPPEVGMASVLDVVRDWLVPDTAPPSGDDWPDAYYRMKYSKWERDQELRARLTEQARIARGEP